LVGSRRRQSGLCEGAGQSHTPRAGAAMEQTMAMLKVPGKMREELIEPCSDPSKYGLMITTVDDQGWELPEKETIKNLRIFVAGFFPGAPSRSWRTGNGQRFGWNQEGVFLHENHLKRYFGIFRESASVALKMAVPEALPEFIGPGGNIDGAGAPTERMLKSLISHLPDVSKDLRQQVLKATFQRADINGNGVLSRVELGTMYRKLVNTMSAADVDSLMQEADIDNSNSINYHEFVDWLHDSASEHVRGHLENAIRTEADIVKASFRVWDKNGDGLIPVRHLQKMLGRTVEHLSPQQVKSLCELVDADHDGNIDYDEFVDFLFQTYKRDH